MDDVELGNYLTDGSSEPYCFAGLASGQYRLVRSNPAAFVSIDKDEVAVTVANGETAEFAFAARFAPTPTATATCTPTPTSTPTPTPRPVLQRAAGAVYNVSGIVLAALALLLTAGLHYLRQRL
jgi:hypothetical protein